MPHHEAGLMDSAITQALDCYRICEETLIYCLQQGGRHAEASHIALLEDCAEICRTTAGFMARDSVSHAELCRICADVCQRCADDCAKFGDDEQMQRCVRACLACAESCRQMAGAGV